MGKLTEQDPNMSQPRGDQSPPAVTHVSKLTDPTKYCSPNPGYPPTCQIRAPTQNPPLNRDHAEAGPANRPKAWFGTTNHDPNKHEPNDGPAAEEMNRSHDHQGEPTNAAADPPHATFSSVASQEKREGGEESNNAPLGASTVPHLEETMRRELLGMSGGPRVGVRPEEPATSKSPAIAPASLGP